MPSRATTRSPARHLPTLALCLALACPAAQAALGYAPASIYPVGFQPGVVAVGDFNGDGRPDVATSNYSAGTVSVLLNNGNGTFSAAVAYATGTGPSDLATGDFDGDGDLDLVTANNGGDDASVFLNNGNGTFAAAINYPAGAEPSSVAVGDLDGDGDLDLAVSNFAAGTVSVLMNNGNGTFAAAVNHPVGNSPLEVAVGDLDNDGDLDMALSHWGSSGVSIHKNNGNGTFAAGVVYAVPYPKSISIGDLNADGYRDLVVTTSDLVVAVDAHALSILLNNGDGSFGAVAAYVVDFNPDGNIIADLDADGRPDVAVAHNPGPTISIGLGRGDGTFQAPVVVQAGEYPRGLAAADFNGDGALDLAVVNQFANTLRVLLAIASAPDAPTIGTATGGNAQVSVAFTPGSSGGLPTLDFTATCGTQSATGAASPLVVTGLTNGTAYTCTVTARNAVGTSAPSAPSNSATPMGNTFTGASATGSGTITASFTGGGPACAFTVRRFIPLTGDPASPPEGTAPIGITFPHGLFDFTTSGCTPGSTITMTITYPTALLTGTQYWKYGPTPGNASPHWYVLPTTITSNAVTFTITDGALGDDDLTANGTIVDQGGPGVPGTATVVPTLSEWAMLLLASLVMLTGMGAMRRR